ncbi:MAG: glycosyltransferase family 2 protein [Pseudomonadota bacterium]
MSGTLLVTTVKNEGPNILEWVAYHRVIGFDRILVFQNDSTDETQKSLRTLARIGAIDYFRNDSASRQWQNKAYRRASQSEAYAAADWCMALDGDEFLNIKVGDGTVRALIGATREPDEILVNWRNFSHSGQTRLTDGLVLERFLLADPADRIVDAHLHGVKALFKTSSYRRPGIHRAKVPLIGPRRIVNGSGLTEDQFYRKGWRTKDPKCRALAQVNHYPTRDLESFLLKTVRGSSSHPDRTISRKYWSFFNYAEEKDTSVARYLPALRDEMARLDKASHGRLEHLRGRSLAIWRDRLAQLRNDAEIQALEAELRATMDRSLDAA